MWGFGLRVQGLGADFESPAPDCFFNTGHQPLLAAFDLLTLFKFNFRHQSKPARFASIRHRPGYPFNPSRMLSHVLNLPRTQAAAVYTSTFASSKSDQCSDLLVEWEVLSREKLGLVDHAQRDRPHRHRRRGRHHAQRHRPHRRRLRGRPPRHHHRARCCNVRK